MRKLFLAAGLALASNAHAFTYGVYQQLSYWEAQSGPSTLQDFSAYADGSSVQGAQVFPGITASTNLGTLTVHGADKALFALGSDSGSRAAGTAYYEIDIGGAYAAAALEIGAYESANAPFNVAGGAVQPGYVEVLLENGYTIGYQMLGNDGSSNLFFGFWSDIGITRIRWYEGWEAGGINEETTIDNLRLAAAVNKVPEPSSLLLAAPTLLLLRRRKAAV